MITIGLAYSHNTIYEHLSRFARDRYATRLQATIRAQPDLFAYALDVDNICGCVGLTRAHHDRTLLCETQTPDVLRRIGAPQETNRSALAEIGTRAVHARRTRSGDISLGIIATLLLEAHRTGIRYFCLTSNRTVLSLAHALEVHLTDLGEPNNNDKDAAFHKNWENFTRTGQRCYGFRLSKPRACARVLATLQDRGVITISKNDELVA